MEVTLLAVTPTTIVVYLVVHSENVSPARFRARLSTATRGRRTLDGHSVSLFARLVKKMGDG